MLFIIITLANYLIFKNFTKSTMSKGLKYLVFLVTNSTRRSQKATQKYMNIVRATLELSFHYLRKLRLGDRLPILYFNI